MSPALPSKEELRRLILASGAAAAGFTITEPADPEEEERFAAWLAAGKHASMSWLEKHRSLRRDPRNVLPEAASIVSIAFPYHPPAKKGGIAAYACRADYHKALRKLLRPVVSRLLEGGAKVRVCVDSAPLSERSLALKAGIARRAKNGCVIVDGAGSYLFLAELLTDIPYPPDVPSQKRCLECDACLRACPGGAIAPDGSIDARRCLSYLTIEHRGPVSPEQRRILDSPAGRTVIFGCDICRQVCPHNRSLTLPEAIPLRPEVAAIDHTITDLEALDRLIAGTPLRRAGLTKIAERLAEIRSYKSTDGQ